MGELSDRVSVRLFTSDLAVVDRMAGAVAAPRSLVIRGLVREALAASGNVAEPGRPDPAQLAPDLVRAAIEVLDPSPSLPGEAAGGA